MKLRYWSNRRLFVEVHKADPVGRLLGFLIVVQYERKVEAFGYLRTTPWVATHCKHYLI